MTTKTELAVITFFAKRCGDVCGSNGLPLTPNSISIMGRGQQLKTLDHRHLCKYLDIIRGKHERTIIVSEYTGKPLNDREAGQKSFEIIVRILYQVADALDYMHNLFMVNHNLEPANILLDHLNNVRLTNYGLYEMTNGGKYISFPIGNVRYMAPERILGSSGNIKSDIWSLGMIIVELVLNRPLWPSLKLSQSMRKILSLSTAKNVLEKIAREHECIEIYESMNDELRAVLEMCLAVSPSDRPTPDKILQHKLFTDDRMSLVKYVEPDPPENLLFRCPLKHIYYWWQLAGGDVQTELKKHGLIRSEAPICRMPSIILNDGRTVGPPRSQNCLMDGRIVFLSLANLTKRLKRVKQQAYYPLIHSPMLETRYGTDMQTLPLVIRERDTEYQFHRVMLFTRLLKGYPFTRDLIIREAYIDIPPLLRGEIWACLLGVLESGKFEKIDKYSPNKTDRQIEVDIPRCHQYDELLSSPTGHLKLKRLLKAWVTAHPQYVYWQGLDSLTAPFLYLNYTNEERAFLSLYKFIPKYLQWFFLKDNSAIIKEYLSKFSQLTAFHEPTLAHHLSSISFIPELFAIPWFLTMFSHVFPLHKIIHLWDKLMLGDNSYPLFIGISVLRQLKTTLLASGFNECILLFSDLPDIVMETCMIESQKMYDSTPKSVTYRKHVIREEKCGPYEIDGIELSDLQAEISPRISAADLAALLRSDTDLVVVLDLRSNNEFRRSHIESSINIPFPAVLLTEHRLDALNVPQLEARLVNRVVVVLSSIHDNAILFSKYLIDCNVSRVCILHNGYATLKTLCPELLIVP